jgi:hypothetical protein
MMNARKVTRVKLQIDRMDYSCLIGLVSADPDYKLSLAINRKLGLSLKNTDPLQIKGGFGTELIFSRFSDTHGPSERIISLVSNRSGQNFLIRRLKNIDYLLHVFDPDDEVFVNNVISGLKEIPSVTAVFRLEPDKIRDKNLDLVMQ